MTDVAEVYQHVAMDTQFPGVVARPAGPFNDYAEYNYQTLRMNIDLTKVLQIGMTFSDSRGNRPKGISTWRFNFIFDASRDLFAQDSVDSLRQSRGLDLPKHQTQGIEPQRFAELLLGSGLVLNEDVRWITFRGTDSFSERITKDGGPGRPVEPAWATFCAMYDFGHLLQILSGQILPDEAVSFFETLDMFFPCRCDVSKHLHRLPQLSGSFFRNAHHILEAFFRLPDSVRRTAFDPQEEEASAIAPAGEAAAPASNGSRMPCRKSDRDEQKHKGNKIEKAAGAGSRGR